MASGIMMKALPKRVFRLKDLLGATSSEEPSMSLFEWLENAMENIKACKY